MSFYNHLQECFSCSDRTNNLKNKEKWRGKSLIIEYLSFMIKNALIIEINIGKISTGHSNFICRALIAIVLKKTFMYHHVDQLQVFSQAASQKKKIFCSHLRKSQNHKQLPCLSIIRNQKYLST